MSIINLAIQSVGLMRQPMLEKHEKMMNSINSQGDIRECARKDPGQMLKSLFGRLELKGKTFQTTDSAIDDTIHGMFSVIAEIRPNTYRVRYC